MKPKQFLAAAVLGLGILIFSPWSIAADKKDVEELVQITMSKGKEGHTQSYGPQLFIEKTEKSDENIKEKIIFRVHYDEVDGEKIVISYSLIIEEWKKVKEMKGREPYKGGNEIFYNGWTCEHRKVTDLSCDGTVDDYIRFWAALDSERDIRGFEQKIKGITKPAERREAEEVNDKYIPIMLEYARSL